MKRFPAAVPGLYLLAAVLMNLLPLSNTLGYEFSVVIALLIPWVSGFWTIGLIERELAPERGVSFLAVTLDALRRNLLLLILPFVVSTVNIFFVRNCSYGEGVLFYLLIPSVTMVYTVALASFCVVAVRRPRFLYSAVTVLTLIYPLYLGVRLPQIYSYNVIFGFFPGFSYDEVVAISAPLIVFRLITLVAALWFIVLAIFFLRASLHPLPLRERLKSFSSLASIDELSFGVVVGAIFLTLSWIFRAQLGFESPEEHIRRTLSATRATEHFRIHYVPGSFTDQEMNWVAAEHEFRLSQVIDALQTEPEGVIDSYIYPDASLKRKFIGAGSTNIAKPWRHEIHINKDVWDGVLRHELVHVLAGEFGMPLIRAHYNIGLVEGLATAVDEEYGNRTLHEYAAAIIRFNLIGDPGALISPAGFMTQSSQRSYVLMGSFCRYLIDSYGIDRLKRLYSGRAPQLVYGKPYRELLEEWQEFLQRYAVPEDWRRHVEYYFNRPSIFAKECARAIAEMNERGWRYLNERQPRRAMDQFRHSLELSWNSEAFGGMVRSAYRAEKFDSVISLMGTQRRDSALSSNLLLYYGDALWYTLDTARARSVYETIAALNLSASYDEMLAVRLATINDSLLRNELAPYFVGGITDSALRARITRLEREQGNPLLLYLRGRLAARRREYTGALRDLERITVSLGTPILDAGREQLIGECYFRLKNFQRAKEHFWLSLNMITNQASIRTVNDWVDRCDWYEAHRNEYLRPGQ